MTALEPCYADLGKWLKRQRVKAGMSQAEAATLLELHPSSISQIEAGRQRVLLHVAERMRTVFSNSAVAALKADAARREEDRVLAEAEAIKSRREMGR